MKKTARLIVLLVVVAIVIYAAAYYIPRVTHTCSNCDQFFVGHAYTANAVSNALTSINGEAEKILCVDCAAKEHALAIKAGKSLKDFRIPLYPSENEE